MVLAVAVAFGGIWAGRADATEARTAGVPTAESQAGTVLDYASGILSDDYRFTLQHYGEIRGQAAVGLVREIASSTAMVKLETRAPELQEAYRLEEASGTLTLIREPNTDRISTLLVLEGTKDSRESVLTLRDRLDAALEKASAGGRWSTKVTGSLNRPAGEAVSGQAAETAVTSAASRLLEARSNGVYRDRGLVNLTFASGLLPEKASGRDDTALQIALRLDTESGSWKAAVGAPMLTGEF